MCWWFVPGPFSSLTVACTVITPACIRSLPYISLWSKAFLLLFSSQEQLLHLLVHKIYPWFYTVISDINHYSPIIDSVTSGHVFVTGDLVLGCAEQLMDWWTSWPNTWRGGHKILDVKYSKSRSEMNAIRNLFMVVLCRRTKYPATPLSAWNTWKTSKMKLAL